MRGLLSEDEKESAPVQPRSTRVELKPRHRRRRRQEVVAIATLIALLVGLGGLGGLAYANLKSRADQLQAQLTLHLQAGQADLRAGQDALKQANAKHDINLVNAAIADFKAARVQFQMTVQIADSSRFLSYVEKVPNYGGQARSLHKAVDGVAEMGSHIADAGVDISNLAAALIAPQPGGQAGKTMLSVLNNAEAGLPRVKAELQAASIAAAGVDVSVVPAGQQATFAKARSSIEVGLADIDEFGQLIPILKEVFGANGPRTYLIEQVNPAELRPGGGFVGSYSVLRANQGSLSLLSSGDSYGLANPRPLSGQSGYVAPPDPLRDLVGTTSWSFLDSNFSPDFPSNALAAERFVAPRLGMTVDAVISIDYYTVAKLLELTGPIQVAGYGSINAGNFISTIVALDLQGSPAHKTILAATAGPMMQTVSNSSPERWPALLSTLNGLAAGRHLQVYFNNPKVQAVIDEFGWTSTLNSNDSYDFMAENEANLGSTKANFFLTRKFSVFLTRNGNLLHHEVTVYLTDDMPYSYRPNEFYRAYIRFFFPTRASGASDDLTRLHWTDPAAPAGLSQLTGWVNEHGYGHTISKTFVYDTPWPSDARGVYHIYWQKQPGTDADKFDITWNDGAGHTFSASSDLSQDRVITLAPGRVTVTAGQTARATLPSLSLG